MAYLNEYSRWQHSRTALPPNLGLDFIRFALLAVLVLVTLAWSVPALAQAVPSAARVYQFIRQPYNSLRDRFDIAFASLRSSVGVINDYYGASLMLGRGNLLTDKQVFAVKAPTSPPLGVRYYWRARSYDTYEDGQWLNASSWARTFNPDTTVLAFPEERGRWVATFDFINVDMQSTFFSPPQPQWVNRPGRVDVTNNPDGTVDVSAFHANPAIQAGMSYSVRASLAAATIAQLQEAGEGYPEWIRQRYLQLPEDISPRTRQLAQDLTAELNTPYEKAAAITDYLRRNITYAETIPAAPDNQEVVDWFLFDLRQGFCNYYATAEIVLLRLSGVPARMAVGYAQGEPVGDGSFIVRQKNAHAWPEVYFPGLGWVEFEPTAAQPAVTRPAGEGVNEPLLPQDDMSQEQLERQQLLEEQRMREMQQRAQEGELGPVQNPNQPVYLLWPLLITAIVILSYIVWKRLPPINLAQTPLIIEATLLRIGVRPPHILQRWAWFASLPPIARAYHEINASLRRLGRKPGAASTPAERAEALKKELPPAKPAIDRLAEEYQLAVFSPLPVDETAARLASREIRKRSFIALFQRFFAYLQDPRRRERKKALEFKR